MKTYITIKKNHQHELVIKKSRFITQLARVNSPAEAQDFIDQIKKQEAKANHNCHAYIIGDHNQFQHTSDDGEPTGTAGVPMLETLQQMQIQNVVAVVTRYFGGIKLGAGGLIRAYRQSVSQAINEVGRVQGIEQQELLIKVDYKQFERLSYWLKQQQINISQVNYTQQVTLSIYVNQNHISKFTQALKEFLNAQVQIDLGKVQFNEVDLSHDHLETNH
ncbi:YigZ family protein [Bombilactobacillus bombi]|uniref:YigZ family protein n=1 Tax=Bombilactobacillus bombi TaxID=1303590 RepID=UPI0015E59F50|nr:YigZ family protein [Bombilactobacillus bombi]MBA1434436.1 YigZ family protein [Bombilactobacillus bombi]